MPRSHGHSFDVFEGDSADQGDGASAADRGDCHSDCKIFVTSQTSPMLFKLMLQLMMTVLMMWMMLLRVPMLLLIWVGDVGGSVKGDDEVDSKFSDPLFKYGLRETDGHLEGLFFPRPILAVPLDDARCSSVKGLSSCFADVFLGQPLG